MARIVHFDLTAENIDRATKFYSDTFEWKFDKWDGPMDYWFITTGPDDKPGINGAISLASDDMPPIMNTIEVDDIDKTIENIKANGGEIVKDKAAIPGIGYYVQFKDTEGNVMGAIVSDPNAK